jgi:hypothetical protein
VLLAQAAQAATDAGFWTDAKWGVLITGTVGVIGVVATAVTAWLGRRSAERLAAAQQVHDERMRADDRSHEIDTQRRERLHNQRVDLYVDLLAACRRANAAMAHKMPLIRDGILEVGRTIPEPVTEDEIRLLTARVDAYASLELKELWHRWTQNLWDFDYYSDLVEFSRTELEGVEGDRRDSLEEMIRTCSEHQSLHYKLGAPIYEELAAQVSVELSA